MRRNANSNSKKWLVHLVVPSVVVAGAIAAWTADGFAAKCIAADATTGKQSISTKNSSDQRRKQMSQKTTNVYDFNEKTLDGKEVSLGQYKGDVLLIVNTASKCGFTPQYAGLEELHKKYAERGLKVLGFPCNQFGQQEPGDATEIGNFCTRNYGVDFQMFEKIDVNGDKADPLYKYLTSERPGILGSEPIKWNFTKFLVDRNGNVLKRYAPNVEPKDIASDIEKQL